MADTVPLGSPGDHARGGPDPLIGTRLNKIEIVRPLDAGGMGTIYLGVNRELDKQYAIKVASNETDPSLVGRAMLEAKALSKLDHPNIVQVFDAWTLDDGRLAIVMPLLSGQTLEKHIGAKAEGWSRPLPVKEVLLLALQLVSGLEEAHRHGLVHRDLKPANVFVTTREIELAHFRTSEVKILDFGLVRSARSQEVSALSSATGSGPAKTLAMGTPEYVSPEQASGSPDLDHRADLYSLGALLFQLLAGRLPFLVPRGLSRELEVAALLRLHRTENAPALATLTDSIPAELDTLIAELLEKDPHRRPASAKDVELRLRPLLERMPREAPAHSPRRSKRGWLAVAALVGASGLLAGGWWVRSSRPADVEPRPPVVVALAPVMAEPTPTVPAPNPVEAAPKVVEAQPKAEPGPTPAPVLPPSPPVRPVVNAPRNRTKSTREVTQPCEVDDQWRKTMLANINELGRLAQDDAERYATFKAGETRLSSLVRAAVSPLDCRKATRLFEDLRGAVSK